MVVIATGLQGLFALVQLIHYAMFCSMLLAGALAAASLFSRSRPTRQTLYFPALVLTLAYLCRGWWVIEPVGVESLHHGIALLLAGFVLSVPVVRAPLANERRHQFTVRALLVTTIAAAAMLVWFQRPLEGDFVMLWDLPFVASVVLVAKWLIRPNPLQRLVRRFRRPAARRVVDQLVESNATTFLNWVQAQPESIVP